MGSSDNFNPLLRSWSPKKSATGSIEDGRKPVRSGVDAEDSVTGGEARGRLESTSNIIARRQSDQGGPGRLKNGSSNI